MATTPFSVAIPWSNASDERRHLILRWIVDRYQHHFPRIEIQTGHDFKFERGQTDLFNRSRARNEAVKNCTSDYVLIADADTAFDPEGVEEGLRMLRIGSAWVIPYDGDQYYNLTESYTTDLLGRAPSDPMINPSWDFKLTSWAGLILVRRGDFLAAGGYDESFEGWGWEDNAFRLNMNRRIGDFERVKGARALHLWHDRTGLEFDTTAEKRNRRYYNRTYHRQNDMKVRH